MGDLNHIRAAVTRRKLNDAEPVAMRIEPHGLSIDRRRAAIARQIGQVGAVQPYRHVALIVDNSCEFVCGRCRNCGSRAVLLRWQERRHIETLSVSFCRAFHNPGADSTNKKTNAPARATTIDYRS